MAESLQPQYIDQAAPAALRYLEEEAGIEPSSDTAPSEPLPP